MGYKLGETMRLEEVEGLGINPTSILDIGAHTGQFYGWSKRVWPEVPIFMIEANHLHESTLRNLTRNTNDNYLITALGEDEREVTFYTRKDKPHTEGNSYYKESNFWDMPQLVQENHINLKKLDDVFEDDAIFDLIKIDTQGSELDILKGGKRICEKASVIIMEISFIEYNDGAPSGTEVLEFMDNFGFENKMSIGEHYQENVDNNPRYKDFYPEDNLIQKDMIFLNKKLDLNSKKVVH